MSYRRRRRGPRLGQFVALELYILRSEAWQSLSVVARAVYVELAAVYNGINNGRLILSGRQLANNLPICRSTATRALQELTEKGFIAAQRPSGFNMKSGERRATEWRLTAYFCDIDHQPATKEFARWKPPKKQNAAA
jgi:biotin operon repressor